MSHFDSQMERNKDEANMKLLQETKNKEEAQSEVKMLKDQLESKNKEVNVIIINFMNSDDLSTQLFVSSHVTLICLQPRLSSLLKCLTAALFCFIVSLDYDKR